MFAPQIVFDAAAAQIRAGKRVSDGAIFRNHTDVPGSIDKDAIPRQQFVAFVRLGPNSSRNFFKPWNESVGQIANLTSDRGCRTW